MPASGHGHADGPMSVAGRTDAEQIEALLMAQFDRPEAPLKVAPITIPGQVAVAGQDNSALAPEAAAPVAAAEDLPGETVYNQACVACHGAGIAGAPKFGDKAAWAARIAQGPDTLHKHALQGFQGKGGYMPPKGGRTDLSDQSVINAVDYIVAASQ
jgi:cytochrome c5